MSNLATITNNILADSGIDDINVIVSTGSYANPAWITSLAWTKITGAPSNIVTGTGTTNTIPRFTGASTIGDSSIQDNTGEVSISKRLFLSTGGQSILLTPNLGGASNRIETSALPLEITTTGSAVRLAAGGVTAQLTLASSGVVTLTNLAGTGTRIVTADASGNLSASSALSGYIQGSGTTNFLPKFTGSTTVGNSQIFDDGSEIRIFTTSTDARNFTLGVYGVTWDNTLFEVANDVSVFNKTSADNGDIIGFRTVGQQRGDIRASTTSFTISSRTNLLLGSNNTNNLTLDTAGNLGLGVTPSSWSSSWKAFEFQAAAISWTGAGANDFSFSTNSFFDATDSRWEYKGTGDGAARYSMTALTREHRWFVAPIGTANAAITWTQAMTLFATGNLLVGSPSPISDNGARLQVNGNISAGNISAVTNTIGTVDMGFSGGGYATLGYNISYTSTANTYQFKVTDTSWMLDLGNANLFRVRYAAGTAGNTISYSNLLTINTSGAATFISSVTAGGQVSINAGNGNQLYLNNSGQRYTQITFDNNSSGSSKAGLWWDNTDNFFDLYAGSGGGLRILSGGIFGSPRMVITSTGNILIGTTTDSGDRLSVAGNIRLTDGANRQIYIGSATNYNYRLRTDGDDFVITEAGVTDRLRYSYSTATWIFSASANFSGNVISSGFLATTDRLYIPGNRPISDWFSSSLTAGYSVANNYGWVNGDGNLVLGTNGVERFRINSTGAATFVSSVTAGGFFASGSNNFVRFTSTGTADWGTVIVGSAGGARTTFLVGQSGYSNGFTVEYTGSAMQYLFRDGNVGIGTTSPTNSRLLVSGTHVSGNGILGILPVGDQVASIGLFNSSGVRRALLYSNTGLVRLESDLDPIQIFVQGNNGIVVQTNGNVGIGTTTDNGYKLNVNGSLQANAFNFNVGARSFKSYLYGTDLTVNTGGGWAQSHRIYNEAAPSQTWFFGAIGTTAYIRFGNPASIDITGYNGVGFGLTSSGAATFDSSVTATKGFFSSNGAADSSTALLANASTNDSSTYAAIFGSLNAGYRMVVRADGNVGIGTTTPQKPLEAFSNANDFVSVGVAPLGVGQWAGIHFGYRENNASYRKSAIVFQRTDLTANDAQGRIHILNGPQGGAGSASLANARLTIAENGNVLIGTTTDVGSRLYVDGGIRASGALLSGGLLEFTGGWSASPYNSSAWVRPPAGVGVFLVNNAITRWAGFKPNSDFDINGGNFYVHSSSGNVGIGTETDNGNRLNVNGNTFINGNILTVAPSGVGNGSWRLGDAISTTPPAANRLVRISINGTLYSLLAFSS